ncbi:hypothetical protein BKA69DRAFT_1164596 [Paraphysoderma sedebokerense]|nr:hypothetical protein BKA69DRAFT_1164596 [Paraphysoderma sedebokerense]
MYLLLSNSRSSISRQTKWISNSIKPELVSRPCIWACRQFHPPTPPPPPTTDEKDPITPPKPPHDSNGNSIPTAKFLSSRYDITFPWLYHDSPPRVLKDDLLYLPLHQRRSEGLAKLWFQYVQKPLSYMLAKYLGYRVLANNLGFEYFPDEFLRGASAIAPVLLSSLSYSSSNDSTKQLSAMMTPELYSRFQKEFEKLKASDAAVEIDIENVRDANIEDVWSSFGPKRVLRPSSKLKTRDFFVTRWMTHEFAVRSKRQDDDNSDESNSNSFRTSNLALLDGVEISVDVSITLDMDITVSRDSDKTILHHEYDAPRTLILTFRTPYFEPADAISRSDETGQLRTWDWDWKVADIDYLLASERAKKRLREEEDEEDDDME